MESSALHVNLSAFIFGVFFMNAFAHPSALALGFLVVAFPISASAQPACQNEFAQLNNNVVRAVDTFKAIQSRAGGQVSPDVACAPLRIIVNADRELLAYLRRNQLACGFSAELVRTVEQRYGRVAELERQKCNPNAPGVATSPAPPQSPPSASAPPPAAPQSPPMLAFMTIPSRDHAPAFDDGFKQYLFRHHSAFLKKINQELAQLFNGERPYSWPVPLKFRFSDTRYPDGYVCSIGTTAAVSDTDIEVKRAARSCTPPGYFSFSVNSSGNSTLFRLRPMDVTAEVRTGVVEDRAPPEYTSACDLRCRGRLGCATGEKMYNEKSTSAAFQSPVATYVGAPDNVVRICAAINDLQKQLEALKPRYEKSAQLDSTKRGPCPEPSFSGFPWFGKGEAARVATREQINIPADACLESVAMEKSFPFGPMTRGQLTLKVTFPVGRYPSCFTETPIPEKDTCTQQAIKPGQTTSTPAEITF